MNISRTVFGAASAAILLVPGIGPAGSANAGPCDIYQAGGTPCVAAHSTVRALYSSYSGSLYQVRNAANQTKDIGVLATGGYANSAAQDSFCAKTTCTISKIYDQSPKGNHLTVAPRGTWLANGAKESNATQAKLEVDGHSVYGVYIAGSGFTSNPGNGYRNNATKGVATGDQPEGLYMVASGTHYNQWCCFDYGNAETNDTDDGSATMEAIFFGNSTQWGHGSGAGPWVMGDLENGLWAGNVTSYTGNTTVTYSYVTAMVKGNSGNSWAIKAGNAQSGSLKTMYNGVRPNGYSPMKKQGAILLGIGGDDSNNGEGTFFEGAVTTGFPQDSTENQIQTNIVQAGYGSNVTTALSGQARTLSTSSARYDPANGAIVVNFGLESSGSVRIRLFDMQGHELATTANDFVAPGQHMASLNAKPGHSGIYAVVVEIDGNVNWSRNIVLNR